MNRSRRRGTRACLVCLWLAACISPAAWCQSEQTVEYPLKLASIYNVTKFVEWPRTTFSSSSSPVVICIAGRDPFPADEEHELRTRTTGGRPIDIRKITSKESPGGCQIIFISVAEQKNAAGILASAEKTSALTIGESKGFIERGGVINLAIQNSRIRFEVNIGAAERKGLLISSRLLALATIFRGLGTR